MEQELIAKYEKIGFLRGIEDSKKQELVQLYEDSIELLEKERDLNNRIEVLYIPVIRSLFFHHNKKDYKHILSEFRTFIFENIEKYKNIHTENANFDYEAELCAQFVDSYARTNA